MQKERNGIEDLTATSLCDVVGGIAWNPWGSNWNPWNSESSWNNWNPWGDWNGDGWGNGDGESCH